MLSLVVLVASLSQGSELFNGKWDVVANGASLVVDLKQNGRSIFGEAQYTNGTPFATVEGTVGPGVMRFSFTAPGLAKYQKYEGTAVLSGWDLRARGTFTQTGFAGTFNWSAEKR